MIGSGLKECHGLSTDDVVEYFASRPGVRGKLTTSRLMEILNT
jgi:hypothetical protein